MTKLSISEIQHRITIGLCARPDCAERADAGVDKRNHLCTAHYEAAVVAARRKGHEGAFGVHHWSFDLCCDCGAPRPAGEVETAGLYRCVACVQRALGMAPAAWSQVHGGASPRWRKGENVKTGEGVCRNCGEAHDWRRNPTGKRYLAQRGERAPHWRQCRGSA